MQKHVFHRKEKFGARCHVSTPEIWKIVQVGAFKQVVSNPRWLPGWNPSAMMDKSVQRLKLHIIPKDTDKSMTLRQ
jgi:hypothetical protein